MTKNEAMQVIEELKRCHKDEKFDLANVSEVLSCLSISKEVNDYARTLAFAEAGSSDGRNVNLQPTSKFPDLQITPEAFNMLGS